MDSIRNYKVELKEGDDQAKVLMNLITTLNFSQYKIFCVSKDRVMQLEETLKEH